MRFLVPLLVALALLTPLPHPLPRAHPAVFGLLHNVSYGDPGTPEVGVDVLLFNRTIYVAYTRFEDSRASARVAAFTIDGSLKWDYPLFVDSPHQTFASALYQDGRYIYALGYLLYSGRSDYDIYVYSINPVSGIPVEFWDLGEELVDDMAGDFVVEGDRAWILGYNVSRGFGEEVGESDMVLWWLNLTTTYPRESWGAVAVLNSPEVREQGIRMARGASSFYLLGLRARRAIPRPEISYVVVKTTIPWDEGVEWADGRFEVAWNRTFTEPIYGLDFLDGYLYLVGDKPQLPLVCKFHETGVLEWIALLGGVAGPGKAVRAVRGAGGAYLYIGGEVVDGTQDMVLLRYKECGVGCAPTPLKQVDEWGGGNETCSAIGFDSGLIVMVGTREYSSSSTTDYNVAIVIMREELYLSDFPWLFTSDAAFVIGDTSGHGPYGFGARTVDVLGAIGLASAISSATGAGSAQLLDTQVSRGLRVDWSLLSYMNVVIVGGPGVNELSLYYNGTCPFAWRYVPGVKSCIYSSITGREYYSGYRSYDYALIQLLYDGEADRSVLVAWGLSGWGTQAACYMLQHYEEYLGALASSQVAAIVKWTNSNQNGMVDGGDTFEVVESWP